MQTKVLNIKGEEVGKMNLNDNVFKVPYNEAVIHQVVVATLANNRQGTKSTLTRSEVSGGGRKPWRQKGTGNARQGSTRAPQWRGGGTVFGPTPRKYGYTINRKVRRLALRSLLSQKVIDSAFKAMDDMSFAAPKTKDFVAMMEVCKLDSKTLFVVDAAENWDNAFLSCRNIPNALMTTVEGMNALDLANADVVVATEAAIKTIEEVLA